MCRGQRKWGCSHNRWRAAVPCRTVKMCSHSRSRISLRCSRGGAIGSDSLASGSRSTHRGRFIRFQGSVRITYPSFRWLVALLIPYSSLLSNWSMLWVQTHKVNWVLKTHTHSKRALLFLLKGLFRRNPQSHNNLWLYIKLLAVPHILWL